MVMPSYLALPPMLESGDYLSVVAGQLAEAFARTQALEIIALPFSLPGSEIRMHWHRRSNGDAGNVWLRRTIAAALAPLH